MAVAFQPSRTLGYCGRPARRRPEAPIADPQRSGEGRGVVSEQQRQPAGHAKVVLASSGVRERVGIGALGQGFIVDDVVCPAGAARAETTARPPSATWIELT